MTEKQIRKKLEAAGVDLEGVEIRNSEIEICLGYIEEGGFGSCDEDSTGKKHSEIVKVLPCFSACYITQYGARICPEGYKISEIDYYDVSSPEHY